VTSPLDRTFAQFRLPLLALGVAFCMFGYEIFNFSLSIDEEIMGYNLEPWLAWIAQGRWGMGLIVAAMPNGISSMPFIATLGFALCLAYSAVELCSLFELSERASVVFICLFVSNPIWPHIAEFNTFSIGLGFGFVALLWALRLYKRGGLPSLALAVLLVAFSTAVYQAFLVFFATAVLLWLAAELKTGKRSFSWRELAGALFLLALTLLASAAAYKGLDWGVKRLLHVESAYVDGYIRLSEMVSSSKAIFQRIFELSFGRSNIYLGTGIASLCLVWLGAAVGLLSLLRNPFAQGLKLSVLALLALVSVFALVIASAGGIPARALLSIPLLFALLGVLAAVGLPWKRPVNLLLGVTLFGNVFISVALFYSDHLVRTRDEFLALALQNRISELEAVQSLPTLPFIAIGEWRHEQVGPAREVEVFGSSFFAHDGENAHRIACYLRLLGERRLVAYSVLNGPDSKDVALHAPTWPAPGSVLFKNGYLYVKFSGPTYAQDMLLKGK